MTLKDVFDYCMNGIHNLTSRNRRDSTQVILSNGYVDGVPPRRSRLQLIALGAAVCGIEFCYAAETAFVSPALLKIGVPVAFMSLVWCLSPFVGVVSVPLLGSMSDGCRSPMGRRRPYIVALSSLICIGLAVVPNARRMGALMGDKYSVYVPQDSTEELGGSVSNDTSALSASAHPFGVLFTIIGVVLLDFGCDACQSPCRAYLLDVCPPADQPAGLSTFTVMAGLGGSLGYLLGGVDWQGGDTTDTNKNWKDDSHHEYKSSLTVQATSDHSEVVFAAVFFIYLICATITVTSIKEIPLPSLENMCKPNTYKSKRKKKIKQATSDKYIEFSNSEDDNSEDASDNSSEKNNQRYLDQSNQSKHYGTIDGIMNTQVDEFELSKVDTLNVENQANELVTIKTYLLSIKNMPRSLRMLCLTHLFAWMSLVSYSLYFTHFVGQVVYKGDPTSPSGSPQHLKYEQGVRTGSQAMALYSISCSAYSLYIANLVERFGAKMVYVLSQLVYTFGAGIMTVWHSKVAVFILSPCAGIMYATLFTMPYLLIASYHTNNVFEGQVRGLGTDVAVVSAMVFLAQFLLSSCMGTIVQLAGSPTVIMVLASILSASAAISATQVMYIE